MRTTHPNAYKNASKLADDSNPHFNYIFGTSNIAGNASLISAAYSSASWRCMNTAWNIWKKFCSANNLNPNINQSSKTGTKFVEWLILTKKLKISSIESYLSSVATILKLKDLNFNIFDSFIANTVLKGGKILELKNFNFKPSRKVMTLDILKIIGHEIVNSDWASDSKRIFWTSCCTMFFGSFRISELLSVSDSNFDPLSCLLWKDVKFKKDSIIIHVKVPKSRNPEGDFIDLFRFDVNSCCPVRALMGLKNHSALSSFPDKPVFSFDSGKLLTPLNFNNTIRSLLRPHLGNIAEEYSSHSFRAAIPSALAKLPNLASEDEIKCWGRWESDAFKRYTRLRLDQRLAIHKKVTTALLFRPA